MSTYYYFYLDFANKAIFILTHVVLAMMISVSFTLIVLATGMVIFLLLGKYIRRADNLGSAGIKNFRDMLKRIDDFWLSVKIAKVHNSERFYYKKFRQANDRMLDIQNGLTRSKAVPALLFSIAGLLTLILFVYIAYQILHIPVPSIFILILLFSRIFPQFSTINNNINTMVSLQSSVRLVLDVRGNLKIKDPDGENESVNADAGTGRRVKITDKIELLNVSFSYEKDSEPVLENFSAVIPAFKITGITGDSGEGKTTLLDIIAGLLEPSKGCVLADGKQISVNPTAWKQGIGYLPQDSFFIDGTIRDNLIWDTPGQISDATIMDVLDSVNASDLILRQPQGLDTYISNYTYHFSGGERQRLALARVLLRKPVLLLLDEATSSLDTKNENSIMELLHALKKKMTIVLITHRTELSGYFDNVIKL
jgi:ATP-binding cassette subfamily C protein